MTILLSTFVFALSLTDAAFATEPTEAEMLSALERKLGQHEGNIDKLKQGCASMNQTKNPYDAMGCLMGHAGGLAKVSITDFEKVGCAAARVGGYMCDYTIRISTGGMMGPMDNMGSSEIITKRFIKTKNGWVAQ